MSVSAAPTRCIGVLDSKRAGTTRIARALRRRFAGLKPKVRILEYRSVNDARRDITGITDDVERELCGVVIDWIGTQPRQDSVARVAKRTFPRAPVVLYSSRVDDEERLSELLALRDDDGVVDKVVPKSTPPEELASTVRQLYDRYVADPVLQTVRRLLETCSTPMRPIMRCGDRQCSLLEMYVEMVRETGCGKEARRAWEELVLASLSDAIQERQALAGLSSNGIIDASELGRTRPSMHPTQPTSWTREENARRCDLIDKEIQDSITPEEQRELLILQRRASEYRDAVAPLPIEEARRLHRKLLKRREQQQNGNRKRR